MPPYDNQTRRSLQLIADSLGMSVASFYEEASRRRDVNQAQDGAPQQMSRDSAELLQSFMTLANPADRQLCIAFVQRIAAGKTGTDG